MPPGVRRAPPGGLEQGDELRELRRVVHVDHDDPEHAFVEPLAGAETADALELVDVVRHEHEVRVARRRRRRDRRARSRRGRSRGRAGRGASWPRCRAWRRGTRRTARSRAYTPSDTLFTNTRSFTRRQVDPPLVRRRRTRRARRRRRRGRRRGRGRSGCGCRPGCTRTGRSCSAATAGDERLRSVAARHADHVGAARRSRRGRAASRSSPGSRSMVADARGPRAAADERRGRPCRHPTWGCRISTGAVARAGAATPGRDLRCAALAGSTREGVRGPAPSRRCASTTSADDPDDAVLARSSDGERGHDRDDQHQPRRRRGRCPGRAQHVPGRHDRDHHAAPARRAASSQLRPEHPHARRRPTRRRRRAMRWPRRARFSTAPFCPRRPRRPQGLSPVLPPGDSTWVR